MQWTIDMRYDVIAHDVNYDIFSLIIDPSIVQVQTFLVVYLFRWIFFCIFKDVTFFNTPSMVSFQKMADKRNIMKISRYTTMARSMQRMPNLAKTSPVWDISLELRQYLKNLILFVFFYRKSWHQSIICTTFRSRVLDNYVIFTFSETLELEIWPVIYQ